MQIKSTEIKLYDIIRHTETGGLPVTVLAREADEEGIHVDTNRGCFTFGWSATVVRDGNTADQGEIEESLDRFEEIKDEMKELLQEALQIVVDHAGRDSLTYERARRYWCAGITVELDKEHSWLAGSMCTMQDTINELKTDGCGNCGGELDDPEYELCSDCR